ncbi:hypothetical protein FM037_19390 [Shewanella psychropiezotolerans]|uniref:Uncharacterized protein n=1 Tax=Shewanella psychropiezotolerans TaxID=2593655 RepID=A0ABX5X2N2_9GAMM|nr:MULTISPECIES: DUF6508 domain-containing protein [Shewanella]MPY21368.1 hypothetical protein [Shewanella sp. YLB-07]MPY22155.1 hypothetical protein [Shewanella sp. YLB-07]QDO84992.1 hypothetical protein FM037_19390 [Shewanella psychropiezotolerans]
MNKPLLQHTSFIHERFGSCLEKSGSSLLCNKKNFEKELENRNLLLISFRWEDWYNYSHFIDRPDYISDSTIFECQLILTAIIRLERFSPKTLDNMRQLGVLKAVMDRLSWFASSH